MSGMPSAGYARLGVWQQFKRHADGIKEALRRAEENGEEVPLQNCHCTSCEARYANILKYMPAEGRK